MFKRFFSIKTIHFHSYFNLYVDNIHFFIHTHHHLNKIKTQGVESVYHETASDHKHGVSIHYHSEYFR